MKDSALEHPKAQAAEGDSDTEIDEIEEFIAPRDMLAADLQAAARKSFKEANRLRWLNTKLSWCLYDREGVSYARVLRVFLPVFLHLEKLQRQHKEHPIVGDMLMREGVKDAIVRDIRHFQIPVPFEEQRELEAAAEYVTRLHDHAAAAPELLCAYMYLMQAAVLQIGRDLRPRIAHALGVSDNGDPDGGLSALALEPEQDADELLALLAAAVDGIGARLSEPKRLAMVAEGERMAALNAKLLATVKVRWGHIARGAGRGAVPFLMTAAVHLLTASVSVGVGMRVYVGGVDVM
ncbi:hypothetical protein JKP88DRAFT_282828 [Tribonema minus]|uniref:Uncharacterized protein n=1 Tax=Tribonema minus TaxID=303371 RepID=A0A835YKH8_9STRA|nr:hypothetical protein JKP88DRAFT_282828 [Tribonema minus]